MAGDALTDADFNVAIGSKALGADTLGSRSVAIGRSALTTQNFTSATETYNVAVGFAAGQDLTNGERNVFIGGDAGKQVSTADDCVIIGFEAGAGATLTGHDNTFVGRRAGKATTSGDQNVYIGGQSGLNTTDGRQNVAVGYNCLAAADAGNDNTAVGVGAAYNCTGANNTAIGRSAGEELSSGDNNMLLGNQAGRTGSPGGRIDTESDDIVLGNGSISVAHIQVDWTVASDARDKTDFTPLDLGLDFVKALSPLTYKWDKRFKYGNIDDEDFDLNAQTPDGTHKEDWLDIGFKAQEVEALEIAAGYNKDNNTNLISSHTSDGKQMGLQYSKFVPILVKAIQEQNALIEALTARVATLEG